MQAERPPRHLLGSLTRVWQWLWLCGCSVQAQGWGHPSKVPRHWVRRQIWSIPMQVGSVIGQLLYRANRKQCTYKTDPVAVLPGETLDAGL